ncbi:FecCD family ABC transporter permease [Mesorhizobium comanense]|uniref:FecCD family ABC transporter permease n=1 Tax=Mesorhizobium comanense TaxID=2502215 RepID=UPI001E52E019|nr:iron ABC transporter permease [Mesorhizobium comanense]
MPAWVGKAVPWILLVAVTLAALASGKYSVSIHDIVLVLAAKLSGSASGLPQNVETVIWNVRLPRVACGLLVGASLAVAGAVYQGLFRNPLVSPDILGVSAGSSLGAVLGIFLSLPVLAIQSMAFAGGLASVALVYAIGAAVRRHDPVLVLVLAGIAVGALLGACISLVKVLADPYNQLPAITFWLLGSLASVTQGDFLSVLPAMIIGLVPIVLLRWRLNLMTLDDQEARALGIETTRMRLVLIASATLMTAAAVSISGIIGWIGLLVPHVARAFAGPNFSRLLPVALLLGGGYLVCVDTLARSIAPVEVPLGILTAAIGAPFFIWLLTTTRQGWQ